MESFLCRARLETLHAALATEQLDALQLAARTDRDELMRRLKALGIPLGKRHALIGALLLAAPPSVKGAASPPARTPLTTRPPSAPLSPHWPRAPVSRHAAGRRGALLLFGLPKFFAPRVFPRMERKLLSRIPLPCDVFVHTYDLTHTSNPRNREAGCALAPAEVAVAEPLSVQFQSQDEADRAHSALFERLQAHGDAWQNHYTSLRNVLREANSLARAHELMRAAEKQSGQEYAVVCCSRMDVLYVDSLPVECIQALQRAADDQLDPNVLFVPNFHEWRLSQRGISRSGGMNDRFAIGGPRAISAYATERLVNMELFCESTNLPFHTETFMQWLMRREGVNVVRMHFRLQRLRATGEVHDGDRELLPV
ncbi:hypothetical protein AB1Y20_023485 [Prymnesium parvum]|uniref:SAM domain-containing protein n=1 Tax=Prymnesium parvum TaxID=97485 RepID=A0AB34JDX0_PRYPA